MTFDENSKKVQQVVMATKNACLDSLGSSPQPRKKGRKKKAKTQQHQIHLVRIDSRGTIPTNNQRCLYSDKSLVKSLSFII